MTYCTSNCNVSLDMFTAERPKTAAERQLIWRMMSHELWKHHYQQFKDATYSNDGTTKLANEYKKYPEYIERAWYIHIVEK